MIRLFNNIFFRMLVTCVLGILTLKFVSLMIPDQSPTKLVYYFDISIAFILFTEGLIVLDSHLEKRNPWFPDFRKRFIKQFIYSNIWLFIIVAITLLRSYEDLLSSQGNVRGYILSIVFGIVNLYFINSVLATRNFLKDRQKRELEKEKLKREKLKSDFNLLQSQLNPHFLFNSLNVLISEIRHNRDAAIEYCESLSDVYRYVLQTRDKDTVSLRTEKEALESHLYLQGVRFGENLIIESDVEDHILDYEIPPMTAHIIIENALKHNIISETKPLIINVKADGMNLIISNNLQLRKDVVSTGIGLKNIVQRYSLLTDRKVKIEQTEDYFSVTIPLLGE